MLYPIAFVLWSFMTFIVGRWYQQRRIERRVEKAFYAGKAVPNDQ